MSRALLTLPLSASLAWMAGCRDGAVGECRQLVENERYEQAAMICARVYEESGDPGAGYAAAQAQLALGREDEALTWEDRLKGTAVEAKWLGLTGFIYQRRGEVDLAMDDFQRQLELHRASGSHDLAADSAYWLYYLSWEGSRYRDALAFAGNAYEEAQRAGDPDRQLSAMEALSIVLYEVGDLDGAQRIQDLLEELADPEDQARQRRLLVNQGLVRLAEGRTALARHAFERALELAEGSQEREFFRGTHINLVKTHLILGDLDEAERHLKEAESYAEPGGSPSAALLTYRSRVERARGRYAAAARAVATALAQRELIPVWRWVLELENGLIAESSGDLAAAEEAYERAAATVEELRRSLGLDEFKAWLLERKRQPLEALFRLRARSGRATAALEAAERAKARTFLDAFVHTARTGNPPPDRGDPVGLLALKRLDALQALLPAMSSSPVVALEPIEHVLDALGGRHLLVYFDAGDELWLLRVEGRQVVARSLNGTPEVVRELVDRFAANLDDLDTAEALGRLLLPAGMLPVPGSTLYVIADRALGRVPFSALRHRDRFLVEDYPIVYVPSATALAAIARRTGQSWGPPVVLGDPLGDLPQARREAEDLAKRLGVTAQTAAAATLDELRHASRAELLHLATHTGLGPQGPWLMLADGRLSASAAVTAGLAPRVVVLATCSSAARRFDGMWGSLAGAFLAAGSEAVLASLGSIEDEMARRFVSRFYREGGAREPAAALARAQRTFIADREPPSLWAPFVHFGVDRPSPEPDRARTANP